MDINFILRSILKLLLPPSKIPLPTVASVDLDRYLGRWYEIARAPNFFEKPDMRNIFAEYDLLPSGQISVRNCSTRADETTSEVNGIARAVDDSNAKLKVTFAPPALRFLPFVWGDYWILDLDNDYQWVVVGEPRRKFLWILSRTPQMSKTNFEDICELIKNNGYDIDLLIEPVQSETE